MVRAGPALGHCPKGQWQTRPPGCLLFRIVASPEKHAGHKPPALEKITMTCINTVGRSVPDKTPCLDLFNLVLQLRCL